MSNSSSRKNTICELVERQEQATVLDDFRTGDVNLLIATSVLEEGVDLTACHLVIDFQVPPNLKSFVQKRGRARQQQSIFAIMEAQGAGALSSERWQQLEAEMIQRYMDEDRERQLEEEMDDGDFDQDQFRIASTG